MVGVRRRNKLTCGEEGEGRERIMREEEVERLVNSLFESMIMIKRMRSER